jgi:hypothetical protein
MSNMSVNKNPYAKNASQETSRGKKLGEAGSTGGGYDAAIVVFNYYQKDVARGPSMDEITIKYIEEDMLQGVLFNFGDWLAETAIPHAHCRDKNFEPVGETPAFIVPSTKLQYFSKVKECLYDKFKDHPDWKDLSWWTAMRMGVETAANRSRLRGRGGGDDAADRRTRTMLKSNQRGISLLESSRDSKLLHWLHSIDLENVCLNMLKAASSIGKYSNLLERRAELVMTYSAVGRGGEVKFQKYSDWVWLPCFEILDTRWIEIKTLQKYGMGVVADRYSYLCCLLQQHDAPTQANSVAHKRLSVFLSEMPPSACFCI